MTARLISPTRHKLYVGITVTGATMLTYYVCEAYYRLANYERLAVANVYPDVVTEAPMDTADEQMGFAYIPNTRTRYLKFTDDGKRLPVDHTVNINNQGHISWNDDNLQKSDSEFRIAVLGDSFTAALEMRIPWPDLLEEHLNGDDDLKARLGVSIINVMNFGRDGIGIGQCAAIHRHEVQKYDADLVVLNFIDEDFLRRWSYRDSMPRDLGDFRYHVALHSFTGPCTSGGSDTFLGTVSLARADFETRDKWKRVRQDLARLKCSQISWLSPYPEFLASRVGHHIGLKPRLFRADSAAHVANVRKGLELAFQACREIQSTSQDALFLSIPINRDEITDVPPFVGLMRSACPDLNVTLMSNYLMQEGNIREFERWFVPFDGHFNDYGGSVYARAVYRKLKRHFAEDGRFNLKTKS